MKLLQAIFFLIIFFLLYKVVKNFLFITEDKSDEVEEKVEAQNETKDETKEIESGELIKDPYCGVFFPKEEGVHLKIKDKKYDFCSEECMRKYLDQNK